MRRETLLLGCPRVAPDWELGALKALMKPQARGAIEHRKAHQPWRPGAAKLIEAAARDVQSRLAYAPEIHFPDAGDYFFACEVDAAACEEAKGFALLASARLPELWFVLGPLFIHNGQFHRRERRFMLNLVPATNVHLTRPIRAALRDLL